MPRRARRSRAAGVVNASEESDDVKTAALSAAAGPAAAPDCLPTPAVDFGLDPVRPAFVDEPLYSAEGARFTGKDVADLRFVGCTVFTRRCVLSPHKYRFDLNKRAARQLRHTDGRACRIGTGEILRHDLIEFYEICKIAQEDRKLHDIVQRSTRCRGYRAQICKYAVGLRVEAFAHLHGLWIEADLSGQIDRIACCHRLRISTDRLGCVSGLYWVLGHK